ncbi:MAG TPA: hypothetical protein VGG64_11190 [Pirellulales bacterium]|jgi:TolA-binding protein
MSALTIIRAICAAVTAIIVCAGVETSIQAEEKVPERTTVAQSPEGRKKLALDDELLEDLGSDSAGLGETTDGTMEDRPRRALKSKQNSAGDALDQELLKGLGDGEDLGEPGVDNPLAKLNSEMREVESLIARHRADVQTQRRQAQIVRKLEELIRQAQKQRQGGNSSSSGGTNGKAGQQTSDRRDVSQPERGPAHSQQSGDAPARESTKQAREDQVRKPDMADMRDVLKGVWGQLPERQREQMLQSYEEQFLPKYEQMIADYFRSLADEQRQKR